MKTINFTIQGQHESQSGEAIVVSSYSEGVELTTSMSPDFSNGFKTNLIGGFEGFKVYENYSDSGSNDYFYFAIKID